MIAASWDEISGLHLLLDESGVDRLIEALQRLKVERDHDHFWPDRGLLDRDPWGRAAFAHLIVDYCDVDDPASVPPTPIVTGVVTRDP